MKKQKVRSGASFGGALAVVLTILAGSASASSSPQVPPMGQLKLSQMTLESTQCPFNPNSKASIGDEQQPAIRKKSTGAISVAAE